jgi:hypothetical protein
MPVVDPSAPISPAYHAPPNHPAFGGTPTGGGHELYVTPEVGRDAAEGFARSVILGDDMYVGDRITAQGPFA